MRFLNEFLENKIFFFFFILDMIILQIIVFRLLLATSLHILSEERQGS